MFGGRSARLSLRSEIHSLCFIHFMLNVFAAFRHFTGKSKIFSFLFFLLFAASSSQGQTLVWEENFDGTAPNSNRWTYDFGNGSQRAAGWGWGNQELQYYTSRPQNVRIEDGILVIEARQENFDGSGYTSGRIKTEGRVHFQYGTVEARIKLPNMANGLWPAFWTLGTMAPGWPAIGEIDILEAGSASAISSGLTNRRVSSATHWSKADGSHQYQTSSLDFPTNLSDDYHIYKLEWTSQHIKMFVDNQLIYSFDISAGPNSILSEFHTPHFFLLNLAVGGQYTGIFNPAGITATLPGKLYVDYIKLYQQPGDKISFSEDMAEEGNFGVLTETTPITDSLTYGTNAELFYWNNFTNITSPAPVPFEGSHLLAVKSNAGDWFGMGVANNYVNLSNFSSGSLKFHFKTTYAGQFKVGLNTGHGETWMNFPAGNQKYGLVRNGAWHEVTIPLADFSNSALGMNIDLFSLKGAFMFAGDPATSAAEFYFDNIYFTGGISPNPAPIVSLTAPANESIFTAPSNVELTATASDPNGTISKVDFFEGNSLLFSDTEAPYAYQWTNTPSGPHVVKARATDNEGSATFSDSIVFYVAPAGNTAPTVAITSPVESAAFLTPANVTIQATAADNDAGIYQVAFYAGTTLLGTDKASPYSFMWANAPLGNHVLTAKATDNGGLQTTSSAVNVVVSNPIKPTVSITSPTNNSYFTPPSNVTIEASAADANGTITMVEFFQGTNSLGTDNTAPYQYVWTSPPIGKYNLTAKATDNDGNFSISEIVVVNVAPPICSGIDVNGDYSYEVYSNGGFVFFKFIPLAAIAGSNLAIIGIREGAAPGYTGYGMTLDGPNFIFSKPVPNGTILRFYFTYQTPPAGERNSINNPHTYAAGAVCVPGAPSVSITSPENGYNDNAPANVSLTAFAYDPDGTIASVSFYEGTNLLGTVMAAPYTFVWANAPAGDYSVTARATDNENKMTTSVPVRIIINIANTNGYCGTAVGGDYEYKVESNAGILTFTMHPLAPIAGSAYVIIYLQEGGIGAFPGYGMTKNGDVFVFTRPVANGIPVKFYFTYQTPPIGERNSSEFRHNYVAGTNCIPGGSLPVSLVSFDATLLSNGQVSLDWVTASEQQNDHFIIEKGTTVQSLTFFAKVYSMGYSNSRREYNTMDANPVSGNNFYRLSQVDKDGSKTYLLTKRITTNAQSTSMVVFPNPMENQINIQLQESSPVRQSIIMQTQSGKTIYSGWIAEGQKDFRFKPATKPAAGLYLIKVEGHAPVKVLVQ